jgi:acyl carrier protein
MQRIQARLFSLMQTVVPQRVRLPSIEPDVGLCQLGFDSLALVSLFVEIEEEFGLPLEAMQRCMHRACTFGALVELCASWSR